MLHMRQSHWTIPPEELGPFDCSVVRCISGEFSESFLVRTTKTAGVDVLRRMTALLSKHFQMSLEELGRLGKPERRRLANDIVVAELTARETMPGDLAPLRTFGN